MDDVDQRTRDGMTVEVDIGLDAVTRTAARARFVEAKAVLDAPREPEVGAPWCALTVRARLHRVGWVLRQDPRVGPRKSPKSCMPEHVREVFKDHPGEPMRIPVPSGEQDVVNSVLVDLLRYRHDDEAKAVIYAIVERTSGGDLGKTLGCSDTHALKLIKRMLDRLALEWNALPWRPDANDVERAKKLIHRNVK